MNSAQIAKATLQRLASSRQEPTPENYTRAWIESGGIVVPKATRGDAGSDEGAAWSDLVEQLLRGLERGGRQWTAARKKDGVQRVLASSRADARRLRERLQQLVASWQRDEADAQIEPPPEEAAPVAPVAADHGADLLLTVRSALPADDAQARRLDVALASQVEPALTAEARALFARRHQLTSELAKLAREMTDSLAALAEDGSWAEGQAQALHEQLGGDAEAPSLRGVRAAAVLLVQARRAQQALKSDRDRAREALRALVGSLVAELDAVGGRTGRFDDELKNFTQRLEAAPDPEALAGLVHDMVASTRAVQAEISDASARLLVGQSQAQELAGRVQQLEGELKRLSDEVATDALTKVSNRRGLQAAFDVETARATRDGTPLAIGLIDLDNFKKLNDSLGHAAGDEALKALAAKARETLRPVDHVARFGGEEFVVLLPATALDAGRDALMRLQRTLSMSLFLHEGREVFVTFSAGVTLWRAGEALDESIERADAALYEAKRAGKNRTITA